ncbi:MAG: ATP-binding protein [Opitutales bacterium]
MRLEFKWSQFWLVCLLPLFSGAAEPYEPIFADPLLEPWRWREMTELAELDILSIDEASDGTMWFGCIGGLARYDGHRIERIPFDARLLETIQVNANRMPWAKRVLCMRDGGLLILMENSLILFKGGEWEVIHLDVGRSAFDSQLEQSEDGAVWLLMPDVFWWLSEDLTRQDVILRAGKSRTLNSFCHDLNGDVWVVRSGFLEQSDLLHIPLQKGQVSQEDNWKTYPLDIQSKRGRNLRICADLSGRIWCVDNRMRDVLVLDPSEGSWETIPQAEGGYNFITRARDGGIWAAGMGTLKALDRSDDPVHSSIQLGLPNVFLSLFETMNGMWWILERGGKVHTLDVGADQWLTYEGLHFECETNDGRQWFLTKKRRVVSYDPSSDLWLIHSRGGGLINLPRSLHVSSHGLLWAVGSHNGNAAFCVYDGARWTLHELPGFASWIWTGGWFEDEEGTVWVGAMGDELGTLGAGGAIRYEVLDDYSIRQLERFSPPQFPYAIHRFSQSRDGLLWVGSPTIHVFDNETQEMQLVYELPGLFTHDLVVDGSQDLWAANGLSGVYRKEEEGWRHFSEEEGLAGRLVVDLLPMRDGTLLAASDGGISRFDGKSWASAVFSDDFGMSNRGGSMRESRDGAMWFNFNDRDARSLRMSVNLSGKDRFRTVRYLPDHIAPDTLIVDHLDRVDSAGNIYVSWLGRDVWLNTPSEQLQYSWRLNMGEWSPFSSNTDHAFVGLDSGVYTLEVRARDRDFNIDPTPMMSEFIVVPAVWQRPWFIAMVLLIGGGAVGLIWMWVYFNNKRLRDRALHLEEIDQMKTSFFTNISHELNTPLGLIKEPLGRLLKKENDSKKEVLIDMAIRNTSRIENLVSQILDFRKLESGSIQMEAAQGDIAEHVRETVELLQPIALRAGISCQFEAEDGCAGWFDRDKLTKIVSNLVGNALKYTLEGGRVVIRLKIVEEMSQGRMMTLFVEDTGPGIDREQLSLIFDRFYRIPEKSVVDGSGIGLNLTKELVDLWGGKIQAESPIHNDSDAPGARFTVLLPIEPSYISNFRETHD